MALITPKDELKRIKKPHHLNEALVMKTRQKSNLQEKKMTRKTTIKTE